MVTQWLVEFTGDGQGNVGAGGKTSKSSACEDRFHF